MLIVPTVRSPSSVIVRGAVILPRKFAIAVGESGTELLDQLLAFPQLPSASTFHCGGADGENIIVSDGASCGINASLESKRTASALVSSPWINHPKLPPTSSQCWTS